MNFAIIDDSETILLLLENILHTFFKNCRVKKFESSEEFFKFSNPESFDLIITDLSLPGISGKELSKLIKAKHKSIPILLITANGTNELVREMFINNLIEDYIDKPIIAEVLVERINGILKAKALEKDRFVWIKEFHSSNKRKLEIETINYIRTTGEHKILEIGANDAVCRLRGTLLEFTDKLEANFIKLGRDLIINKNNIKQLNYSDLLIYFNAGDSLPVNKTKFAEIEKLL